MWKEHVVQDILRTCAFYQCDGAALADPNRPRGQQKCPQMGCLGLGKERDATQADSKTKLGDSSYLCDQHHNCGKVTNSSQKREKSRSGSGIHQECGTENTVYRSIIQDK